MDLAVLRTGHAFFRPNMHDTGPKEWHTEIFLATVPAKRLAARHEQRCASTSDAARAFAKKQQTCVALHSAVQALEPRTELRTGL